MISAEGFAWRSLLFVPADQHRFIKKAIEIGVDACILDLEDSIAPEQKEAARGCLASACSTLREASVDAFVRINVNESGDHAYSLDDVTAALDAGVVGLVLPKVNAADAILWVDRQLETLSPTRKTVLIAQIEDVAALPNLDSIAQCSRRLVGMSLGTEDFSASAGMAPNRELLFGPSQSIVFACRRAGIMPYGFPASIAEYGDVDQLRLNFELARDMGFIGAMCIHPKQASLLNEVMKPSASEVRVAEALLAAWEKAVAENKAVIRHDGKMVDKPVVLAARKLLERARRWN